MNNLKSYNEFNIINENVNYENNFITYDNDKFVYHITSKKIADIINKEGFLTGHELNVSEKRKAIYFADHDVNYGIYARNGEGDIYEGDEIGEVKINIKGLKLLNITFQDKDGKFPNHKKYSAIVTRGELEKIPYDIDGTISYLEDGGIYEVALKKDIVNNILKKD